MSGVGANAKMNEFCAVMGLCNLRHIDSEIAKRKGVVERYIQHLSGVDGIKLSPVQDDVESNYAYFPAVFDENVFGKSRDLVSEQLAKEGIFSRKYFYPLANDFDCYKDKYDSNRTPVAKEISNRVLTLPLYADLELDIVDKICNIILK